jgi:hypothetical protein
VNREAGRALAAVLPLGDNQYEQGSLAQFQQYYEPSWGRVKAITRPVVGNHEYETPNAAGHFSYFGAAAGTAGQGWYSFDVGAWHLIALNSNCNYVGCGSGTPQLDWLKADLAAHPASCTLAYFHHPRFSSGPHGNIVPTAPFWTELYRAGADVVLGGHDHDYERFAPQSPIAESDRAFGIREFVVGTGGRSHYDFGTTKPNSKRRESGTFGILELTLRGASYSWRFVPEAGKSFSDRGGGRCHGAPSAPLMRLRAKNPAKLSATGRFAMSASCTTACRITARATVATPAGPIRSRRTKRRVVFGREGRIPFSFRKADLRALRKALAGGKVLRVSAGAAARDLEGDIQRTKLRFSLRG